MSQPHTPNNQIQDKELAVDMAYAAKPHMDAAIAAMDQVHAGSAAIVVGPHTRELKRLSPDTHTTTVKRLGQLSLDKDISPETSREPLEVVGVNDLLDYESQGNYPKATAGVPGEHLPITSQ